MIFKSKHRLNPDDILKVPEEFEQQHKQRNIFKWPLLILFTVILVLVSSRYIFHVVNSVQHPPVVIVKPTPVPHLEPTPYRMIINIKQGDDLNNTVKQQVQSDHRLQEQKVGLVIIYTGAPTVNDVDNARQIDEQVKKLLQSLKTNNFAQASYYDRAGLTPSADLYVLSKPSSFIMLDLYLYNNGTKNLASIHSR